MSEDTKPIAQLIEAIETAYGEMLTCEGVGDVYPHLLAARKAAEVIEFRERVDANFRTLFHAVDAIERRLFHIEHGNEGEGEVEALFARTERARADHKGEGEER